MKSNILFDLLQMFAPFIIVALAALIAGAVLTDVLSKLDTDSVDQPHDYLYMGVVALFALIGVMVLGTKV